MKKLKKEGQELSPKKIAELKGVLSKWKTRKITPDEFDKKIKKLYTKIPKEYSSSYPALEHEVNKYGFTKPPDDNCPRTLAEALLWKMGKWSAFKTFVENYKNPTRSAPKNAIVFYAFAQHLREEKTPIFDQHALRAIWAITESTDDQNLKIASSLFNGKGKNFEKWKSSGSGEFYNDCREIYHSLLVSILPENYTRNNLANLDRFLMPLGQVLKKKAPNFNDFRKLIGKENMKFN
jgi:hypothetical protein